MYAIRSYYGRVTRWAYDDAGRPIARVLPEGQRETFAYNAAGELSEQTDFNGQLTRYGYDAAGREVLRHYASEGREVVTTYTLDGQVETLTDERGTTRYQYGDLGRLTRIDYPTGLFIEYGYDSLGRKVSLKTPERTISYRYDVV